MKRGEIEEKLRGFAARVQSEIEKQPVNAFLAGIVIGIVIALFAHFLIPLVVVAAIVVLVLWFFSDEISDKPVA